MWFIKYLGDVLNGNILFSSLKVEASCFLLTLSCVSCLWFNCVVLHHSWRCLKGFYYHHHLLFVFSTFFFIFFSKQHCGNVSYSIWLIKEIKNFHKETFLIFSQPDNIPTVRPVCNLWQCTCNLEMMENDVKTEYNSCSQNRWNFVCVENERARFFL